MQDQYARQIDYLRVSVTDRCNLRCRYCMPEEGVELMKHSDILTYDEILRICSICTEYGISHIKITGGEPLVRKGVSTLAARLKALEGIKDVTLTTNGVLLKEQMKELAMAGIDAVNISLDTLDEEKFRQYTRRDSFRNVLEGIREALSYPQIKVKLNCVTLLGENDDQWVKLASIAREHPVDVRFIEMMPIGIGQSSPGGSQEIVYKKLVEEFGEGTFLKGRFGNGPAVYLTFPDFKGKIGFISAVSHKFCGTCNRIRLTSDGFMKPCLQYASGTDLKALLRGGADDKMIGNAVRELIFNKPRSHQFSSSENKMHKEDEEDLENRKMSSIGG